MDLNERMNYSKFQLPKIEPLKMHIQSHGPLDYNTIRIRWYNASLIILLMSYAYMYILMSLFHLDGSNCTSITAWKRRWVRALQKESRVSVCVLLSECYDLYCRCSSGWRGRNLGGTWEASNVPTAEVVEDRRIGSYRPVTCQSRASHVQLLQIPRGR